MPHPPPSPPPLRVLVVDDEIAVLRAHARLLEQRGFEVETARDAAAALEALPHGHFDVVVSDVYMPGMSGLELVERLQARQIPVVVVTGQPSIEVAARLEPGGGAWLLTKPVEPLELLSVIDRATQRRPSRPTTEAPWLGVKLDTALQHLHLHYQPIVSVSARAIVGHEVLMRTGEVALASPLAVLDAARRLERLDEVGRRVRGLAFDAVGRLRAGESLFVNLVPEDLLADELYDGTSPLCRVSSRVVLEITEHRPLDGVPELTQRLGALRAQGFRVALDDFGAGYSSLQALVALEPELVKIDRELVADIDARPRKRATVRTLLGLAAELGAEVVAEGVERPEERDCLRDLGCDLLQGYFYGRPARDPVP